MTGKCNTEKGKPAPNYHNNEWSKKVEDGYYTF